MLPLIISIIALYLVVNWLMHLDDLDTIERKKRINRLSKCTIYDHRFDSHCNDHYIMASGEAVYNTRY